MQLNTNLPIRGKRHGSAASTAEPPNLRCVGLDISDLPGVDRFRRRTDSSISMKIVHGICKSVRSQRAVQQVARDSISAA
jgi:hypothetical protein